MINTQFAIDTPNGIALLSAEDDIAARVTEIVNELSEYDVETGEITLLFPNGVTQSLTAYVGRTALEDAEVSDEDDYYMLPISVASVECKNPATLDDVLDGSAHLIADGAILRASNPGLLTDDPDAPMAIIVSVYPEPGMPNSYEVFRVQSTEAPDAQVLEAALRERYTSFSPQWDD